MRCGRLEMAAVGRSRGRGIFVCSTPVWSAYQVPGYSELHSETVTKQNTNRIYIKKKKKGWIQSSVNWCQVTVKASDTFAILRKYSITDPHGQALESTIHFKILTLKVFHAFMCTTCVQKSERGVRSLGTSIIDGWQPLMIQLLWVLEIELRSSARVISILNPGPFLQPQVLKECLQLLCLGLGQHMVSINCNLCLQEKDEPDRWT